MHSDNSYEENLQWMERKRQREAEEEARTRGNLLEKGFHDEGDGRMMPVDPSPTYHEKVAETVRQAYDKPVAPRKRRSIHPFHDRILVRPLPDEDFYGEGLLVKPDSAKVKTQFGKVLAHGPGITLQTGQFVPVTIKVGTIVIFGKYAGMGTELNGEELILMRSEELMGELREEEALPNSSQPNETMAQHPEPPE